MSPTSCRCSTPRRHGEGRGGRTAGGWGGGAAREGRSSQGVAPPVLRRRWRWARPGSGWDRVDRRRVRSRPAPPRSTGPRRAWHGAPPRSSSLRSSGSEVDVRAPGTGRRRRGPPPWRAMGWTALAHAHRSAPTVARLSTRGRSTRWSAGGLTCSRQVRSVISRWGSHLDALSGSPIPT